MLLDEGFGDASCGGYPNLLPSRLLGILLAKDLKSLNDEWDKLFSAL